MKILVCFKTVADADRISQQDWQEAAAADDYEFPHVPTIIDPLGESALELALRLKDQDEDGRVHLTALSVGNKKCEKDLRTLAALGFNELYRVHSDTTPHPVVASYAIASFCRNHGPYDLILMGDKSPEVGSGKTPLIVSELLTRPCMIEIDALSLVDEDEDTAEELHIHVERGGDYGIINETLRLPLIATVGDVPGTLLRVPTLKQRNATKDVQIHMEQMDHTLSGSDWKEHITDQGLARGVILKSLTPVHQERDVKVYTGEDATERVYEDFLKGKVE